MNPNSSLFRVTVLLGFLASLQPLFAAEAVLPPLPAPQSVPAPGPKSDAPYAPQAILSGGVVLPLYPPDSPYLKAENIREPEVYGMWSPGQVGAVTHIHNPSIEFHPGNGQLNTGAAIILAGGGGHRTLNVGEASPFVSFFANHGVSTIILRNRLRSDGYEPRTDGVNDARGHHPGDKIGPDEPPATGALSNMGGISYGTWSARFLDWFRDLGFLNKPGVETLAARDVAANLNRVKRSAGWNPPPAAPAAPAVPVPAAQTP